MLERRDINVMIDELKMTGDVIRQNIIDFKDALAEKEELFTKNRFSKIYAVGCGDSLFAGEAAKMEFLRDTGVPYEACEALEFCRYDVDYMPENALVFVISYSGSVARTIEAAYIAKRKGATVIAITGKPENKLAKITSNSIIYKIQSLGFAPGTISFTASLMMMYMCAIKVGECSGYLSKEQVEDKYRKLEEIADLADQVITENQEKAKNIMLGLKDRKKFYVIGAGPNYAIAKFAAAKFIEGAEIDGIYQELEEWAHEQYFLSGPDTDTIIISPNGAGNSRAKELIKEMNFIETGSIYITSSDCADGEAQHEMVIPGTFDEEFSPLLTSVAASLLGYYISYANNKTSYNFRSKEQEEEHYMTLHCSEFREELRDVDECYQ